jgi:glucose-1-phosphate thymidylyltransferase
MKAVLLCAGFATRLYPLTHDRAKPLLPVGGRPVLSHLLDRLRETGSFRQVVVVANHRFHAQFAAWAAALEPELGGLELVVLDDGATDNESRRGAVGDLAFALDQITPSDPLLVAAGDNLLRLSLRDLMADYDAAPRSLVLVHEELDVEKQRRTGIVELDSDDRILRLWEKPEQPPTCSCTAPIYLLRAEALSHLEAFRARHPTADAPGHFLAYLVGRHPVYAHPMRGERLDLGDLETYRRAEAWLAEGEGRATGDSPSAR